jgi:hypothetical protein
MFITLGEIFRVPVRVSGSPDRMAPETAAFEVTVQVGISGLNQPAPPVRVQE